MQEIIDVFDDTPMKTIQRKISQAGIDAIKRREGFRRAAYEDQGGKRTIGYGHTFGVRAGETITPKQGEDLLIRDLGFVATALAHTVKVPVTQCQYDALSSFVFNIGGQLFEKSSVLKSLNEGDYRGAAMWMLAYNHVHGKWNKGLTIRRRAEAAQFLNCKVSDLPIVVGNRT